MKVDIYQLQLEQARTGKSWEELGVDRRLIAKIKKGGDITPVAVSRLATKLGVDPERITVRG